MPQGPASFGNIEGYVDSGTLLLVSFLALIIVIAPRKYALFPFLILACFMTMGQRLIIASADFTVLRLLLIAVWSRVLIRREASLRSLTRIDKRVIWFTVSAFLTYTVLWSSPGAAMNRLGFAFDLLGLFFLFRCLLRDIEDLVRVFKILALIVVFLSIAMTIENWTGRNLFAVLGGVPEFTVIREGKLRCQGPFAHPILAGTFGATLFPVFASLSTVGRLPATGRALPALAAIASVAVVLLSASSGPLLTLLAGAMALFFWPLRNHMRNVRWAIFLSLVGLHIVMKAPVWFLISRLNPIPGSTGWHRSYLIDRAIAHFWEWWLVGTRSTAHWGWRLWDVTNHYVEIGVRGGVLTLGLFILIIAGCFAAVGAAVQSSRLNSERRFFWALGSALFAHSVAFLAVSYFDQIIVSWYLLLAVIANVSVLYPVGSHGPASRPLDLTSRPVKPSSEPSLASG